MKNLTASDRKSLIRLAAALEKGSPERRAILAGMQIRIPWSYPGNVARYAEDFNTRVQGIGALKRYLAKGSWPGGEPPMLSLGRHIAFKEELERVLPPGTFRRIRWS